MNKKRSDPFSIQEIREKIEAADADTLRQRAERVLTAQTLDEVLD